MTNPLGRRDPDLLPAFAKDEAHETFLAAVNARLEPLERERLRDLPEVHPTLFVFGAPRSGTTLLHQVLAAHLDVTYIHNLAARFYKAPCTGLRLGAALVPPRLTSDFTSRYGRTANAAGPHEFGYFWTHWLRLRELREPSEAERDAVDWAGLRRTIVNMAAVFDRPVLFKPLMVGWYQRHLHRALPRSLFLWIQRDPLQTAISIFEMRREMLGDAGKWMSLIPAGADPTRSAEEQVAAQLAGIERAFAAEFEQLPAASRLKVSYERLCTDPAAVVDDVAAAATALGERPLVRDGQPAPFPQRAKEPAGWEGLAACVRAAAVPR